ncbi:MAG: PD-(D/E)XK nuclease family protein [Acidimicrobiia bacterium]|nr:PD-(D/E)XK nuclease family protein [Acidimicrobiia bacterium]
MIHTVIPVSYGRPATDALADAIAEVKSKGGPLAPVTVIVPSNIAGLYARRLLGARRGLANVSFVTPFRFAELLSADVLVDRRPLTNPMLGAAVRVALRDDPRPFGDTADHRATEDAVARLYATVSHLSTNARRALAADAWGALMVRLYERVHAFVRMYDDDNDVARAARARDGLDAALDPFGALVWYLPEPVTDELGLLMRACFDAAPAHVIVGRTGDPDADAEVRRACRQVGVDLDAAGDGDAGPLPTASTLISVTDADEEVRHVISSTWQLAESGTPMHRIAIVYPVHSPYLRTLHSQLAAARMPFSGPSPFTLADTVPGSVLLGVLGLDELNWRRDRVMALVASGPLRHRSGAAQPAAWERVSRAAGVVGGRDDWDRKLAEWQRYCSARAIEAGEVAEHSANEEDRSAGVVEAGSYSARRWRSDALAAEALRGFVADLGSALDVVRAATEWSARADAAVSMLETLLGTRRTRWPDEQLDALDRVTDSLARLHQLDAIEPAPTLGAFVSAVEAELEASAPRVGRFGAGVALVPLAAAAGLDVDAVFVLGMAEGLCPSGRLDNALLPESLAERTDGEVATPTARLHIQHRQLLAALAGAPAGRRTMTFARGDLRTSRRHLPSRWLLASASELAGEPVLSDELDSCGVVAEVASFAARLASGTAPASEAEHDLALVSAVAEPTAHPAIGSAGRGIVAQRLRRSREFTEWDGNISGHFAGSPADDAKPMSPTRLETWATCGMRYFLGPVLGLRERDDPERITELGALDKGNVLHKVLEDFVTEALSTRVVPAPRNTWSDAQRRRLHEIGDELFDQLEREGKTGRALLWTEQRRVLHQNLDRFLAEDDRQRAARGTTPDEVERSFGIDDAEPLSVELADGRILRFRGRIDRIDRTADGAPVVYDYKSGSGSKYEGWNGDADAVMAGTVLQPAIYAEAVRDPSSSEAVEAALWFLEPKADKTFRTVSIDGRARQRFRDVATTIVDGVEAGAFPAVPGEWNAFFRTHANCAYCPFDILCPADRGEHAAAKADEIAPHRRGLEIEPDGEAET